MIKHALTTILLLCPAAASAQGPLAADCGAAPAAEACVAKPKNTDIFGLPLPAVKASRAAGDASTPTKLPTLIDDKGPAGKTGPRKGASDKSLPAAATAGAPARAPETDGGAAAPPDFSRLEHASNALHLWLGLSLAMLALSEAFAADNPGSRRLALAGCGLAAALAIVSLAAAALALGPGSCFLSGRGSCSITAPPCWRATPRSPSS